MRSSDRIRAILFKPNQKRERKFGVSGRDVGAIEPLARWVRQKYQEGIFERSPERSEGARAGARDNPRGDANYSDVETSYWRENN